MFGERFEKSTTPPIVMLPIVETKGWVYCVDEYYDSNKNDIDNDLMDEEMEIIKANEKPFTEKELLILIGIIVVRLMNYRDFNKHLMDNIPNISGEDTLLCRYYLARKVLEG